MTPAIQIIIAMIVVGIIVYKTPTLHRHFIGVSKKIRLNKKKPLNGESYRKLALGAICSEHHSAYINSLETGIPIYELKLMLNNFWEVYDIQSAHDALSELLENAQHSVFPVVLSAYENQDNNVIYTTISNERQLEKAEEQLANLQKTLTDLQDNGVITSLSDIERLGTEGWELGRLVYLSRMCFDTRFISEAEAWGYISAADHIARSTFDSWQDFACSFTIGGSLWGSNDATHSDIAYIASYLLTDPASPWVERDWH